MLAVRAFGESVMIVVVVGDVVVFVVVVVAAVDVVVAGAYVLDRCKLSVVEWRE